MKKFIVKLTLFFVLFVCGSCLLDYCISSGLKRTEDYRFQTWNDIIESKINADVLIMGNSRAFSHFSPRIIDSTLHVNSYNIGMGGQPFNVQYMRYQIYEKHNRMPRLIIQNIDFVTFFHAKMGHEREQVFPFVSDKFLRNELSNYGFTKPEIYLPLYRYFGYQIVVKNGLLEYFKIKHYNSQPSYKGYRPEQGSWDGTELDKITKIEPAMDSTTIHLFDEFLSHCYKNHIQVVLVNTPVYYKATQKIINADKFNSLITGFSKKYKILYLDYAKDPMCFDTVFFHIAEHLNKNGAELFSAKFSNDLKKLSILKSN